MVQKAPEWLTLQFMEIKSGQTDDRIQNLVNQVRSLHAELDSEIRSFQSASGLHCLAGCGKCCLKPDIEATPLEFLPLALSLYHEGVAAEWQKSIESGDSICKVYNEGQSGQGKCTRYPDRGMICRLFGYSARKNKYSEKELITCQIIKEDQREAFDEASARINSDMEVPGAADFYARLRAIDAGLGGVQLPVNRAIAMALDVVMSYYFYKEREQA